MNISINTIEQESWKKSQIHDLDSRVKIILTFLLIIYSVYTTDIFILFIIEIYILLLVIISKISIIYYLKRILTILPFGGFIAVLQPFIKPGIVLFALPFGLTISYEGLLFGTLLLSRLIVCLSVIVLLSSVTPLEQMFSGLRKLGFPKIMASILSMTIRYLFFFFDELANIRNAQKSRAFDIWNKKVGYLWRLKQIGYTIMMLFLNSFEKGERVYYSMLGRGYTGESIPYHQEKDIIKKDYLILFFTILFLISIEIFRFID